MSSQLNAMFSLWAAQRQESERQLLQPKRFWPGGVRSSNWVNTFVNEDHTVKRIEAVAVGILDQSGCIELQFTDERGATLQILMPIIPAKEFQRALLEKVEVLKALEAANR